MELRQLITFQTVASTLNFSRAAAALNYVPSNVTMQIQALEKELKVRLFDRLGKQLLITDAGKNFLLYVNQALNTLEEAKEAVCKQEQITGTVTISANEVLCAYRLPSTFLQFRKEYPAVRLIFQPVPYDYLKQSLCDGKADIVFLLDEPIQSTSIASQSLVHEQFFLVASADHPILQNEKLSPEHFREELFLINEKGCTYRTLFDQFLKQKGIISSNFLEFSSAEALKQCAMAGIGIAFLPEVIIRAELDRGELAVLPMDLPNFPIYTQMLWHKEKWLSPAIEAFMKLAQKNLSSK
ncbi:LysR family transcriptional regulator [Shimazuella sp. AN120528]|uniref:LysR family transcriptional regulator n=1 Tax=Shimazuella soli TaxID=1892854 RepID=UPI001F1074B7|nr:LysR family transcriptional regulator [Shimazuella soli]MCH5583447.1 LysR family transcriptional regulator [Shimazuella soli]